MAHVTTAAPGTLDRLHEVFKNLSAATLRYLAYRRTLRALSDLDDRMLEDLGLDRADLPSVARKSVL